jgi:nucleoid-associated protein YgaU
MAHKQSDDDKSLLGSIFGRDKDRDKPDFSNVRGGSRSTEASGGDKPDFSNVQSGVRSTEQITGGTGERTYTVESGDTLSHIAKAHYGKAGKWRAIFEANRDQIDDPDRIFPGQVLKIPAIDTDGDGDLD